MFVFFPLPLVCKAKLSCINKALEKLIAVYLDQSRTSYTTTTYKDLVSEVSIWLQLNNYVGLKTFQLCRVKNISDKNFTLVK